MPRIAIILISAAILLSVIGLVAMNLALAPQATSQVLADKPPTKTPKPPPGSTPTLPKRAFVTDRNDPSKATLLINTEDGTVIKEYAGSVEISSSCDRTRHFLIQQATSGVTGSEPNSPQEILLGDTLSGDIIQTYLAPNSLSAAPARFTCTNGNTRAIISWSFQKSHCDPALVVPCLVHLLNSETGDIIQSYEAQRGAINCDGDRVKLNLKWPDNNPVQTTALVDASTGDVIVPFSEGWHDIQFLC